MQQWRNSVWPARRHHKHTSTVIPFAKSYLWIIFWNLNKIFYEFFEEWCNLFFAFIDNFPQDIIEKLYMIQPVATSEKKYCNFLFDFKCLNDIILTYQIYSSTYDWNPRWFIILHHSFLNVKAEIFFLSSLLLWINYHLYNDEIW